MTFPMSYCRYQHQNVTRYGLIESVNGEATITQTLVRSPNSLADFERGDNAGIPLSAVRLLAPVEPSKIVCIGRNYREHAKELNHPVPTEPLFFLKPPSSVIATGEEIRRPNVLSQRVDYEGELGVVIGKGCYRLRASDDVRPYILGYTCINDVTARDLQEKDGQWTRAKSFDTFCPVGPVVVEGLDPWKGVGVQTRVNGQVRQSGTTVDFLFPLDVLICFISQVMTLNPGDLIATGTPAGVGPVQAGDTVEVTVEGVGTLTNSVVNID
jgi:2-keto-4-pentenoate hydratase/2-oxohepta-3-ene-1,7-dioic acid hydratase in catechol pathway